LKKRDKIFYEDYQFLPIKAKEFSSGEGGFVWKKFRKRRAEKEKSQNERERRKVKKQR